MMKYTKIIFISISFFAISRCYSQVSDTIAKESNDILIDPIEEMPVFEGGENALHCFIFHNLDTNKLKEINKSGIIVAQFIIDTTGVVRNIEIIRGIDSIANNEFLRIIKLMPSWVPAKQNNKKVAVRFNLPLRVPYINKFCH